MTVSTYHINHLIKTYFKQTRLINQARKNVQQSMSDTVRLSTVGKRRLFEKMKDNAIDQVKAQYGGK